VSPTRPEPLEAPAPLVIVAAVNGGMQRSRDGATVPITPEQIAEDARLCREAGAAVVHVHARDRDGANTGEVAIFEEIIGRIRERSDILIQTTNGIGVRRDATSGELVWPTDEERLALVNLDPGPDLYGVAAGSTDFWHPSGGYPTETAYVNSAEYLKATIAAVYAKPSTLEYEVVDAHVFGRLARYADDGLFDRAAPYVWLLLGGGLGDVAADPETLVFLRDLALKRFPNACWGVLGAGRSNFRWATLGIAMGATTARIGFEDGLYLPDGSVGARNHELVAALAGIAEIFGRRPATPAEARRILDLDR
jgi:3-keto-5-aminohexanoate cleavage enzyme